MYEKAIELIKEFEGFRASAYRCPAGVWTIGFGSTQNVKEGDFVTMEEAECMLRDSVGTIVCQLKSAVSTFSELSENQVSALIDFVYNLGIGNFLTSTMLKRLNEGEFESASLEFGKWVKAGGKTLPGLVKRREAERQLFVS